MNATNTIIIVLSYALQIAIGSDCYHTLCLKTTQDTQINSATNHSHTKTYTY